MIIVYLSIALAVAALVYLGISGFRTFKAIQPTLKALSDTAADIQEGMDNVTKETEHLKKNTESVQQDIQVKKQAILDLMGNAKWSVEEIKSFWRITSMPPNPQRLETIEINPEIRKVEDQLLNLWERWRRWRG